MHWLPQGNRGDCSGLGFQKPARLHSPVYVIGEEEAKYNEGLLSCICGLNIEVTL